LNLLKIGNKYKNKIEPEVEEVGHEWSQIAESEVPKAVSQIKVKRNNLITDHYQHDINDKNDEKLKQRKKIKVKRNNFVSDNNNHNSNDNIGYNTDNNDPFGYFALEKFFCESNLIVPQTFDGYSDGKKHLRRRIIIWAHNICFWIIIVRFIILANINKPWIWSLLTDPFYLAGKQNLVHIMLCCFTLNVTYMQYIFLNFEKNQNSEFLTLLRRIGNNTIEYKLEDKYYRKFCKKLKFAVKYLLGPIYLVSVYSPTISLAFLKMIACFDPNMDFSLITLILIFLMEYNCLRHGWSVAWGAIVSSYMIVLHIYYYLRQTADRTKECVESGNSRLLINTIHEHNYYSDLIHKLSGVFNKALAIIYFFETPPFNIIFHLVISNGVNTYMRIVYSISAVTVLIVLFALSSVSSLSTAAHSPTSSLNSFLARNKCSIKRKLKISGFLEKLSGPVIGFYCYNFFALTSFAFFEYIVFNVKDYILMSGLLFTV